MTYFLRDAQNRTLVDLDFRKDNDFSVVICIKEFSEMLMTLHKDDWDEFIADMDGLQELRGTWWETPGLVKRENVKDWTKKALMEVADKWGLYFVVD
jgi:hypothetical protein